MRFSKGKALLQAATRMSFSRPEARSMLTNGLPAKSRLGMLKLA